MADIKPNRESSEGRGGTEQAQGRGGILQRRGETVPSLFSLSPRDFFSMNPFHMMRRLTEDMDRMFTSGEGGGMWSPSVEVRQQGDRMQVLVELPGMNKEDVHIEVTDAGLAISGERKREHKQESEGYYRSERSYGQFYRLIPLPENAQVEQAKASFNNGVLEISIPAQQAESKRREIPIEAESGATRAAGGGTQTRTSGGGSGA